MRKINLLIGFFLLFFAVGASAIVTRVDYSVTSLRIPTWGTIQASNPNLEFCLRGNTVYFEILDSGSTVIASKDHGDYLNKADTAVLAFVRGAGTYTTRVRVVRISTRAGIVDINCNYNAATNSYLYVYNSACSATYNCGTSIATYKYMLIITPNCNGDSLCFDLGNV